MVRLIGILTGSAIAVAILIVALGIPEFVAPEPPTREIPMRDVPTHDVPTGNVIKPAEQIINEVLPEPAPDVVATPAAEVLAIAEPEPQPLEAAPDPLVPVTHMQDVAEQHWYAFWSPFRSKIAADGFVSQLQRTTGLDYRVVKLKPGVYEVAFAYANDSDIEDKLTQISSATGLDLSGG